MVEITITIPKYLYEEMKKANEQLKKDHGYDLDFSEFLEHAYNGMIDIIDNQTKIIYQLQYGKVDKQAQAPKRVDNDVGRAYL